MCGIAGFLGAWPPASLEAMADGVRHRGPDGYGVWWSEADQIGLAHRRLAIIDCTAGAAQPMASCAGRYRVVFNGEIYNFRALAAELKEQGYRFNERSDTAILGPLYDVYGPEMLCRLNGIFAFAIWDSAKRRLFAARDAFGVKPFYYAATDRGFAFASEIKALLPIAGIDRSIDTAALRDYLVHLWSPGARTMFESVKKLLPGHYVLVEDGAEPQFHAWSEQSLGAQDCSPIERPTASNAQAELLALFDEVVADQCVSDVPIGAFLSGGVDSSAIVASMVATGHRPVRTYCVGFDGDGLTEEGFGDDLTFARRFAATVGVPLEPIVVQPMEGADLERLVYQLEEPQADPAPLYVEAISKAARADGIKVLMSGAGGDDIFSGYRRHSAAALRAQAGSLGPWAGKLATKAAHLSRGPLRRQLAKIGYMLDGSDEQFLIRAFEFTPLADVEGCLSANMLRCRSTAGQNELEKALARSAGAHLLDRMLLMERAGFLPDHNLNYTDKASMAAGVEIRVPFLDERLVAFADRMAPDLKVRGSRAKWLLKEALRGRLPDSILDRKKTGFGAPVRLWVAGPMRPMIEDVFASASFRERGLFDLPGVRKLFADTLSGRRDGAYLILAIVMVELWLRRFSDLSPGRQELQCHDAL
jgi:asparagine synthase (glutamine-hydrolysing)